MTYVLTNERMFALFWDLLKILWRSCISQNVCTAVIKTSPDMLACMVFSVVANLASSKNKDVRLVVYNIPEPD